MLPRFTFASFVSALTVTLLAGHAAADGATGFAIGTPTGMYYPLGVNLGYGFGRSRADGGSLLLGVEGSIVQLNRDTVWVGGYMDVLHDFAADEQRISIGPEIGYAIFGVDGGYLLVQKGSQIEHGFVVRPLVTLGLVSLYCRFGFKVTEASDAFGELGLLMKYPFSS